VEVCSFFEFYSHNNENTTVSAESRCVFDMKIQQLICVFLASLVTGEATDTLLRSRGGRYLTENSTSSGGASSETSNVTYASRTDDDKNDDNVNTTKNDDDSKATATTKAADDDKDSTNNSSVPFVLVHKKEVSMTVKDDDDGSSSFTPPEEVEPQFWKEAVAGIFLALALVLCGLTARKTCCKPRGYREIPSTTLVV
jgi:hypothetical protein